MYIFRLIDSCYFLNSWDVHSSTSWSYTGKTLPVLESISNQNLIVISKLYFYILTKNLYLWTYCPGSSSSAVSPDERRPLSLSLIVVCISDLVTSRSCPLILGFSVSYYAVSLFISPKDIPRVILWCSSFFRRKYLFLALVSWNNLKKFHYVWILPSPSSMVLCIYIYSQNGAFVYAC